MKFKLRYAGRQILISVIECKNTWQKIRGLMFRKKEQSEALLFDNFCGNIHSFFVFFPFLAIWLDEKNKILSVRKIYPFNPCILPSKNSFRLLEIPINSKYFKVVKSFSSVNQKI